MIAEGASIQNVTKLNRASMRLVHNCDRSARRSMRRANQPAEIPTSEIGKSGQVGAWATALSPQVGVRGSSDFEQSQGSTQSRSWSGPVQTQKEPHLNQ